MPSRTLLGAAVALATLPATVVAQQGTLAGTAWDSLARRPFAGATIHVVRADAPGERARTATTDSLGRWTLGGLGAGEHLVALRHPALDSLGLDIPERAVRVDDGGAAHVDLALAGAQAISPRACAAPGVTPRAR